MCRKGLSDFILFALLPEVEHDNKVKAKSAIILYLKMIITPIIKDHPLIS